MGKCELCGQEGNLSEITREERGKIMVCRECRENISEKEQKSSESSGSESGGSGLECPHCG